MCRVSRARRRCPVVAASVVGMQQVTDSRKAAVRYRAEYLRQSNAPTSAPATCDNSVRCTAPSPRRRARPRRPRGPPASAAAFQTTLS
ncbi:unnamed protein product [Danaus chrysippus]|uniref:(African queen) hypothetical protein n=1 Tax=Danaus chrysippus TaxID=151541 RepID=A0A8J2VQC8_9NEOP|nr:unnamed protein product [Danaus chrysippus]